MSEFYSELGARSYKNLLADPQGADAVLIPCEPGNGDIPAGTVMYKDSNGLYKPASTDQVTTSYYLVVLGEDVATGAEVEPGAAPEARAYRAGCFIDGAVKLASDGELSADNVVLLRLMGITFGQSEDADPVINGLVNITYVANNEVTPAEADVVVSVLPGSSYTILDNSDSSLGFTAPDGLAFAGWNTAADGSGTDYAASDSYTASADLTLYALWAADAWTLTFDSNNGDNPHKTYVAQVEKGESYTIGADAEAVKDVTPPAWSSGDAGGWKTTPGPGEEGKIEPDPEIGDYIITPTEDMTIYVIWYD